MNCVKSKKIKTKSVRGSQPEWNEDFTIKTRNPERWMLTIKLKKSSTLGLNTSITVGSDVICVYALKANEVNSLTLYDECYFPVGKARLEFQIDYLPEIIPRPKISFEPKGTPAEVPSSSEPEQETDEKKPEPKSPTDNLHQTIDDTGNVTKEDAEVGETEAEAFLKVVEQQPASESAAEQSTGGYQPTNRNYMNNFFINPSPAPNKTLFDILDMMQTDAELVLMD
jgi:hypothetical protein